MNIKKILMLYIIYVFFLNSSCFASDDYKSNGVIGCADIINMFNKYDYEPFVLKSPKGYEKALRQVFIKESTLIVQQYLLRVRKVNYKFLDKICFDLDHILNEKNYSLRNKKIQNFTQRVISIYKNKIRKVRINYQLVSGCEKYASLYVNSLIEKNIDNFSFNTVARRQYLKCVNIQERRIRRNK